MMGGIAPAPHYLLHLRMRVAFFWVVSLFWPKVFGIFFALPAGFANPLFLPFQVFSSAMEGFGKFYCFPAPVLSFAKTFFSGLVNSPHRDRGLHFPNAILCSAARRPQVPSRLFLIHWASGVAVFIGAGSLHLGLKRITYSEFLMKTLNLSFLIFFSANHFGLLNVLCFAMC